MVKILLHCILILPRAVLGMFLLVNQYRHVHRRTSLMSSFLLLQQCPACLIHLTWMVLEMGGKWSYSCCFLGRCFQDLFSITPSIHARFLSSFSSMRFVSVHVMHPSSSTDPTAAGKKSCFIISDRSNIHLIDCLSIAAHSFAR